MYCYLLLARIYLPWWTYADLWQSRLWLKCFTTDRFSCWSTQYFSSWWMLLSTADFHHIKQIPANIMPIMWDLYLLAGKDGSKLSFEYLKFSFRNIIVKKALMVGLVISSTVCIYRTREIDCKGCHMWYIFLPSVPEKSPGPDWTGYSNHRAQLGWL